MIWVFVVVAALLVFAIAAATVGTETFRLRQQPLPTIFDLDEAVHHVADTLPGESQARLTYDEVRDLIRAELEHLVARGVFALPGEDLVVAADGAPVVIDDDDAVAAVLGHVTDAGLDVDDTDVVRVVDALHDYLAEIGAVGPQASPPVSD